MSRITGKRDLSSMIAEWELDGLEDLELVLEHHCVIGDPLDSTLVGFSPTLATNMLFQALDTVTFVVVIFDATGSPSGKDLEDPGASVIRVRHIEHIQTNVVVERVDDDVD